MVLSSTNSYHEVASYDIDIIMMKFADVALLCSMAKNASWNNTFHRKTIKNGINYCVLPTSCPFNNFQGVIHVEQLTVSTIILEEAQLIHINFGIQMA